MGNRQRVRRSPKHRLHRSLCTQGHTWHTGRFGLQDILDNFTIDDCLPREGWDATKRNMQGRGPITVQLLVSQAREKELDELASVMTL